MKKQQLIGQEVAVFCFFANLESQTLAQANRKGDLEKQRNFSKIRKDDFSKLIGGIQEGAKLNYNGEKTNLEGSGGTEIKSAHLFIQGASSIGTTTNLSNLFSQKALPTFSGSLTPPWMISSSSTLFYDGSFRGNFVQLHNPGSAVNTISTLMAPGKGCYSIKGKR